MDTVQILKIDIPVKAHLITSNIEKFKKILRKYISSYLQKNGNYYANGVVYPNTIEIIEWQSGIKQGSILGDEMIFTTRFKACFRMYPIGSIHQGRIVGINQSYITVNNEYIYNVNIPLVKSSVNIDLIEELTGENTEEEKSEKLIAIESKLKNNNSTYPYLASDITPNNLKIGQTVEFIVLDLSSKYNPYNIIVLGFLSRIIDNYTKVYSINCSQHALQINEVKLFANQMMKENKSFFNELNYDLMLPTYYKTQDKHYIISTNNVDIPVEFTQVNDPVDNYYMCYYMKNPEFNNNIINNMNEKSVLLIELELTDDVTVPFTESIYNYICKHFANITLFYDWSQKNNNKYTMWIVGSYYIQ